MQISTILWTGDMSSLTLCTRIFILTMPFLIKFLLTAVMVFISMSYYNNKKEEFDIVVKPSRTLLMLQNSMLFQRNLIRCLSLFGIDQISIDLCGDDILVRQHLRYCVNVCI